jgi:RNA polymerase sigma-70 factor (ECF subfamily)
MGMSILSSDIIKGLIAGDEKTYVFLFKEYYICLCSYARRFVGRKDIAEEIVSETFFKLWENRGNIIITNSVKSYLFKAVANNSLLYLRELKKQEILTGYFGETSFENIGFDEIPEDTADVWFQDEDISLKIEEAVRQLPQQQQKAFRLKRFQGRKNYEIAEIMGLSLKTVEMHLSKAMLNLRQKLKAFMPSIIVLLSLNL